MSTIIRELTDIQGVNVSAPTENPFTATGLETFASDAAYEVAHPTPGAGEFYFNTTSGAVRIYNGTAWQFDKTTFSAQTDAATTGANVDLAPNTFDQIILFTHGSLTSIRSISPANQRLIHLYNGQASNGITLVNEAAAATAANRIRTGTGADIVIQTNSLVSLLYDEDSSRWRVFSRPITGLEAFANDAAYEAAHGPAVAGSRYWNTTKLAVHEYDGTGWHTAKVFLEAADESALTGADQDLVPSRKQIIKLTNASLTSIRAIAHDMQHFLILINGTGATLTIRNQSSGGTATQRIITGTGVDLSLENDASILLAYDSQTNRWRVTGGSGSGGTGGSPTNVCLSPNDVATQWSQALGYGWYSSAATAASTTTTAAELPLDPVVSTAIKITRTTVGSYDSYRWKMPTGLKQNTIPISWLQIAQTGMTSGEFKLDVYTYTDAAYTTGATRKNLRSDSSSVTSIPAYSGYFGSNNAYTFDAADETYYEMRVTRVSGTNWLSIAGIKIGFDGAGVAAAHGEYESTSSYSITATISNPTPGTGATYYRNTYRVGRWAIIRYEFRQAIAGSAGTGDYFLPLPSNLSIDYTRAGAVTTSSWNGNVGDGTLLAASTVFNAAGHISNSGSYANKIHLMLSNETTAPTTWSGSLGALSNAAVQLSITVRIPIQGWDDAVIVGPNNVSDYGSGAITSDADTSVYVLTPGGSRVPTVSLTAMRTVSITWPTPTTADHCFDLELDYNGDGRWVPHNANEFGSIGYVQQNTASYGMWMDHASSVVTRIRFAIYAVPSGATFGAAGTPWTSFPATVRWRCRRWRSGIPAGLEYGQLHGGAQLYKAGYAPGLTTGATIGAGYIGQKITWSTPPASSTAFGTTETDWTNASISLTAGVWLIIANLTANPNTGTTAGNACSIVAKITDSSNNLIENMEKQIYVQTAANAVTAVTGVIALAGVVSISSTTVYKIRAKRVDQNGASNTGYLYNSSTAYSEFFAIRIA